MQKWMGLVVVAMTACGDNADNTGNAMPDATNIDACVASTPTIVFLNRAGGTYTPGPDDAVANISSTVTATRTLAPWAYDDQNWNTVKQCVTTALAGFNVTVTDFDPGAVDHHEIVFSTTHWESNSIGAIGPLLCTTQLTRSIMYVFGSSFGGDTTIACEYAMSQLASAASHLDHSLDCHDFLGTFPQACGPKTWVDKELQCGEYNPRACMCGGPTQNSYRKMLATFGPSCQ